MDAHFGGSTPVDKRETTPGMVEGLVRSAAEGVPVVGGVLNKLDAATNALLSYANGDVKGPWSERYNKALDIQNAKSKSFEEAHPVASTLAGVAGGLGAGGALLKTAPALGSRVLGLGGDTMRQQVARGALSGAGIGAADAATRGEDIGSGADVGLLTGAVAPVAGRAIGKAIEAYKGLSAPPLTPSNTVDIAGVPVRRTVGQATGDTEAITHEQMALRGADNSREQAVAREYFDAQKAELEQAREAVAGKMHPSGEVVARTPQEAASLAASQLADNQRVATAASERAAQALAGEGQGIHLSVGGQTPGQMPHAANPLEAAGIVSHGVGQIAADEQAAYKAAYDKLKEVPGQFHPASFNTIDNEIKAALNRGSEPVRISPEVTPNAHAAVEDVADILSGIRQQRGEDGRIIKKPPLTAGVIDEARKRLGSFFTAAKDASYNSPNGRADLRAMGRVMDAFDNAVERRLGDGRYIGGDPQAVLSAFDAARGKYSSYRKTFTSQGAGDEVGQAIQKIAGRYEGQAMPPEQVRATLYGNGSLPIKIAQRFKEIFGEASPEYGAIKQGYFTHLTQDALGNPLHPEKAADNLQKAMKGTLGQAYFSPLERQHILAHAENLRASVKAKPSDIDTIVERIGSGHMNASDLAAKLNTVHGGGQAERLVQRLKSELTPQQFAGVKQGQWAWLNEHAGGPLDVGSRKVVNRIRDFLDGEGKPLAEEMFTPQERALIRSYGDLMGQITSPPGTVNYSNTAAVLGKMFRGSIDTFFGGLGMMHAGPLGMAAGYGADRAQKAIGDVIRATKVAKLLYGTPQGVNAIGDLQRSLGNLASFGARATQPALSH